MTCSSPRLVIWQVQRVEHFCTKLEEKIQHKQYELLVATQVLKYTTNLQLAAESYLEAVTLTTYFARVQLGEKIQPYGIDRIVPIEQALNSHSLLDEQNFLGSFMG